MVSMLDQQDTQDAQSHTDAVTPKERQQKVSKSPIRAKPWKCGRPIGLKLRGCMQPNVLGRVGRAGEVDVEMDVDGMCGYACVAAAAWRGGDDRNRSRTSQTTYL